eukprot:CAMPEP_0118650584 /NCGR_PEP_ID=MMETSP0785-20121206/10324_1 /TAXON_ID=91992 /ORGANISM="Bolidomonas pacifica, Strain CCMP 1866" /LENGTH=119 /DNA_ID=CAMNT_0006542967 /DNA_START=74 /DNA_END=430 /DNA_ORIENTATION=+
MVCSDHSLVVDKGQLIVERIGERGIVSNAGNARKVITWVVGKEVQEGNKGGGRIYDGIVIMGQEFDWLLPNLYLQDVLSNVMSMKNVPVSIVSKSTGVGYGRKRFRIVVDFGYSNTRIT